MYDITCYESAEQARVIRVINIQSRFEFVSLSILQNILMSPSLVTWEIHFTYCFLISVTWIHNVDIRKMESVKFFY